MYINSSAFARQWRQFGAVFRLWVRKRNFATSLICITCRLTGDKILSLHGAKKYDVQEVGVATPSMASASQLTAGQVGYIIANMREVKDALIGDTLCHSHQPTEPLPGFKPAQPMVSATLHSHSIEPRPLTPDNPS